MFREVVKYLESLSPQLRARIVRGLRVLGVNPYESRASADMVRLRGRKGRDDLFRLRVGDCRVIYAVAGKVVYITGIFQRGRGCRQLP